MSVERIERYRVGSHYGIHVYEGDRPVATFHTTADAKAFVEAANDAEASARLAWDVHAEHVDRTNVLMLHRERVAEERGAERVATAVMAWIDPDDPPMGTRDTLRRPDAQFVIRRVIHAVNSVTTEATS